MDINEDAPLLSVDLPVAPVRRRGPFPGPALGQGSLDGSKGTDADQTSPPWICQRCYMPRGEEEEAGWRRMYAVPETPDAQCDVCGCLPAERAIQASLARGLLVRAAGTTTVLVGSWNAPGTVGAASGGPSDGSESLGAEAATPAKGVAQVPQRRQVDPSKLLLSRAEAARLIGVDRKTTLRHLIENGDIETVAAPRGTRIARSEIDRLLRDGIPKAGTTPKRSSRNPRKVRPPTGDIGAAIRSIDLK